MLLSPLNFSVPQFAGGDEEGYFQSLRRFGLFHFPFAFSVLFREWMGPIVGFRAIADASIPEFGSTRS